MSCCKRVVAVIGLCLGACVLVWWMVEQPGALAETKPQSTVAFDPYPNCRFGVTTGSDLLDYDVASLNAGWYLNWTTWMSPPHPGGAEYMQMVRLTQDGNGYAVSPPTTTLLSLVDAHPGATWLIGNEPDGFPLAADTDSMYPDIYARAYHDLYYLVKNRDPSAQIAIGAIIQPTPLRFEYLDTVWDTYYQTYSETMPVDIWNVHSFILRETTVVPDPEPCEGTIPIWGAYVPRGATAATGELYCIRDQDDLDIFWQRIREFRQWMASRGERNKPLIITEYGVLFPEDYDDEDGRLFSQPRVGAFMTSTFDLMLNETDPLIGYPYDDNRLVQRWAWFSLSEAEVMGGALFDEQTKDLRLLGQYFRDYTAAITPTVDLVVARTYAAPAVFWYEEAPVTTTLKAVVSNIGNISTSLPITVTFYDGPPGEPGTNPIGAELVIVGGLQGCADYEVVETEWSGLAVGTHQFYVKVTGEAGGLVTNNVAEGKVLVANYRVVLPTGSKDR